VFWSCLRRVNCIGDLLNVYGNPLNITTANLDIRGSLNSHVMAVVEADRNRRLDAVLDHIHAVGRDFAVTMDRLPARVVWESIPFDQSALAQLITNAKKVIGGEVRFNILKVFGFPRNNWNGISSGVFLNQVHRRHRKGVFVNLVFQTG